MQRSLSIGVWTKRCRISLKLVEQGHLIIIIVI